MRVVCSQKRVVEVEFSNGDAIGPRSPLRTHSPRCWQSDHGAAVTAGVCHRLFTCDHDWRSVQRSSRHRRVIDHAVLNHLHDIGIERHVIASRDRQFPRELLASSKSRRLGVDAYLVPNHASNPK